MMMSIKIVMIIMMIKTNNQQLAEGLESGDLSRLIDRRVTVDEYKSKIGKDEEIVVLTFKVQGKNPALDLVTFIEKSYDWVLDADSSSGELEDGNYLVFVEADREESLVENIMQMFEDVSHLTDIKINEWILAYHKPHKSKIVSPEAIKNIIPLTPEAYEQRIRERRNEIDNLKIAAGINVETRASKNDFTESLRIAAGIR